MLKIKYLPFPTRTQRSLHKGTMINPGGKSAKWGKGKRKAQGSAGEHALPFVRPQLFLQTRKCGTEATTKHKIGKGHVQKR